MLGARSLPSGFEIGLNKDFLTSQKTYTRKHTLPYSDPSVSLGK